MSRIRVYSNRIEFWQVRLRINDALALQGCVTLSLIAVLSPAARGQTWPPFTEEAQARGVNYTVLPAAGVGFEQIPGVAFADLDLDGDQDLVLAGRSNGVLSIFENNGAGQFTEHAMSSLPMMTRVSAITAADYDGDADLDLYVTQFFDANYLFRNDGAYTFTDVTVAANVADQGFTTGATWGDYDGDGFLDLYVCNYSWLSTATNNRLYHNLGNATFEQVAEIKGVDDPQGLAFQASFVDVNHDGWVDLYNVNDYRNGAVLAGNSLWLNDGAGEFVDISETSGAGVLMNSMGITTADFDRNGWLDFYVSDILTNHLFLSSNGTSYSMESVTYDLYGDSVGWGVCFFDGDNNGWQDLYVCNSSFQDVDEPADRLFVFSGIGQPCTNMAPQMGIDQTHDSFSVASADIDDDGDIDLAVVQPNQPLALYINHADQLGRNWLKVRLRGSGANLFAVGAVVSIQDTSGWQRKPLVVGDSLKSQQSMDIHFGMGESPDPVRVDVLWPGGMTTSIPNVMPNRTIAVYQQAAGDIALNGLINKDDLGVFVDCLSGPNGGDPGRSCTIGSLVLSNLDFDNDVDLQDYAILQASVVP